ncbi:MAG TPA: hypothetical protein VK277_08950 [Acidimicrobiales bacterium]|nr:hypothetical protein [Acidimicrobiales bacterium]
MAKGGRIGLTLGLLAVALVVIIYTVIALLSEPQTIDFTANHQPGQPVNITLQTVGSVGPNYSNPTWVSYMTLSPQGQWEHTTLWDVPPNTRINMTIIQYDSGSPLRNQQIGQVTGTFGNVATINGRPFRVINSNSSTGNGVAHTFSMPSLGVNVPLYGNSGNANLCGAAPCTLKSPHNIIRFSFVSPSSGNVRWQCFVPCGLAWLYGNGGPMSTIGYMGGFMKVVS